MEAWHVRQLVYFFAWLTVSALLPHPPYQVFFAFCWIFLLLDDIAKKSGVAGDIGRWLDGRFNPDPDAAKAILAFFDFICALPLLLTVHGRDSYQRRLGRPGWTPLKSRWAILPWTLITVVFTFYLTYSPFWSSKWIYFQTYFQAGRISPAAVLTAFWSGIPVNIISDYLALFVIRRWLVEDELNPQTALLMGAIGGILLVISFTGLRLVFFMIIDLSFFSPCPYLFGAPVPAGFCENTAGAAPGWSYLDLWNESAVRHMAPTLFWLHLPGVLAACLVHLGLPIFAASAFLLRLLNLVLDMIGFQRHKIIGWIMKEDHPVLALGVFTGLLAGIATFLIT